MGQMPAPLVRGHPNIFLSDQPYRGGIMIMTFFVVSQFVKEKRTLTIFAGLELSDSGNVFGRLPSVVLPFSCKAESAS